MIFETCEPGVKHVRGQRPKFLDALVSVLNEDACASPAAAARLRATCTDAPG